MGTEAFLNKESLDRHTSSLSEELHVLNIVAVLCKESPGLAVLNVRFSSTWRIESPGDIRFKSGQNNNKQLILLISEQAYKTKFNLTNFLIEVNVPRDPFSTRSNR